MRGTRLLAAALALMLILCSCNASQADSLTKLALPEEQILLSTANTLLSGALDEIFLYQGEIPTDRNAEPYWDEAGRRYYPVVGYATVAELRTHSREIFTEDFCANVLDGWTQAPQKPRFVEREGGMWATHHVEQMGWIDLLVLPTLEIKEQSETQCVVSAFSQSMMGEVTREEFLLKKEADGWRLDSYYKFNRKEPLEKGPTLGDFLTEQDDGRGALLQLQLVTQADELLEMEERLIPPFQAVLAALEYDPESVTQVDEAQRDQETPVLQMNLYTGTYLLTGFRSGEVYITQPGGAVTRLQLEYPAGMSLLSQLAGAAKWNMKEFD